MTIYSYARVSTRKQALANDCAMQRAAIKRWSDGEGVEIPDAHHFEDSGVSGKFMDRPAWDALMGTVKGGDSVVAYNIARCARNLLGLLQWVQSMRDKGVRVVFVKDMIDLDTPMGSLMLAVLGALAQWQREMGAALVKEGMAEKKAKGAVFGRRPILTADQARAIGEMSKTGHGWIERASKALNIHRHTVRAYWRGTSKPLPDAPLDPIAG